MKNRFFRGALIYEDSEMAMQATQAAELVCREMDVDGDFQSRLWKSSLFEEPETGDFVMDQTVAAEIVILALRNTLSPKLQGFVHQWAKQRKDHSGALVALFENPDDPSARRARVYLKHAAANAGMDFFAQPVGSEKTLSTSELLWVI